TKPPEAPDLAHQLDTSPSGKGASMKIALIFLVLTVLIAWPAVSPAQTSAPAESKGGAGQEIKDSWITSKTKTALVTDGRVKARRIKVETQGGMVTLMGTVPNARAKDRALEMARKVQGVRAVRNELQLKS